MGGVYHAWYVLATYYLRTACHMWALIICWGTTGALPPTLPTRGGIIPLVYVCPVVNGWPLVYVCPVVNGWPLKFSEKFSAWQTAPSLAFKTVVQHQLPRLVPPNDYLQKRTC